MPYLENQEAENQEADSQSQGEAVANVAPEPTTRHKLAIAIPAVDREIHLVL